MPTSSNLARSIGYALQPFRPGPQTLATRRPELAGVPDSIEVSSPAFTNGGAIPAKYTVDGDNVSPPLEWKNLPPGTQSVVLLVEDADAPSLRPLVHAILYHIPPGLTALREGAIPPSMRGQDASGFAAGRNSFGRQGWVTIVPPPGHGPHRYAFQVLALDTVPHFDWPPGRVFLLQTIRPHVLAQGTLVGIYQRK